MGKNIKFQPRFFNAERWRNPEIPTMKEWIVKMSELAKKICIVRNKTTNTFINDYKIFMHIFLKKRKKMK